MEPLLTRAEELRSGRRIKLCLHRMRQLLSRYPAGYMRYMARMEEVISGGGTMFSWLPLRERMVDDLRRVSRALERAESLAARTPDRAVKALAEGVKLLLAYPLDPETLSQWTREVLGESRDSGALGKLKHARRVARILRKCLDVLERERDRLVMPNFRLV
ncbi:MAG TPA: hypothetical protein VMT52_02275, partial [Planctomycetota bacterium]|nr:hypothetical protein [Planctomycetota bacterium]